MGFICKWLPPKDAHDIEALWREYEDQKTPAARLVSLLDKYLQVPAGALREEYANSSPYRLDDFFKNITSEDLQYLDMPKEGADRFALAYQEILNCRPTHAFLKPFLNREADPSQDGPWMINTVLKRAARVEELSLARRSSPGIAIPRLST